MKMLFGTLLLLLSPSAFALTFPNEGGYGSNTIYCGLEIHRDPRNNNLLITYIHNPAYSNVLCQGVGHSVVYEYVAEGDYFYFTKNIGNYCILKTQNPNTLNQACYRISDDSLMSSVRYIRYY